MTVYSLIAVSYDEQDGSWYPILGISSLARFNWWERRAIEDSARSKVGENYSIIPFTSQTTQPGIMVHHCKGNLTIATICYNLREYLSQCIQGCIEDSLHYYPA